jgi:CRISPR-associated endonuclease/helicase Cas3
MLASQETVLSAAHDPDLVYHLIGGHHGWCRPFAPPVVDPNPVEAAHEQNGATFKSRTNHHLARLDSGVADRFWILVERYGWWGLAWLETIFRLADHHASALHEQEAK